MDVELDLPFLGTYRRPRRRTEESTVFTERSTFRVAEATSVEAPVLGWFADPHPGSKAQRAWRAMPDGGYAVPIPGDSPVEGFHRATARKGREDRLICVCAQVGIGRFLSLSLAGDSRSRYRGFLPGARALSAIVGRHPVHRLDADARPEWIVSDERGRTADAVQAVLDEGYVVIEGVLHERRRNLPFGIAGDYSRESGYFLLDGSSIGVPHQHRQAMDVVAALEPAQSFGATRRNDRFGIGFHRRDLVPEIVRPDLLPDPEEQLLRGWIDGLLHDATSSHGGGYVRFHGGQKIAESDDASMLAFLDLRDAYFSDASSARLVRLLEAYVGAPLSGIAGTSVSIPGERMIQRFRDRSPSMAEIAP